MELAYLGGAGVGIKLTVLRAGAATMHMIYSTQPSVRCP
jgi:hypothetical protein